MRFVVNSTKLLLLASAVSLAACGSGGDGDTGSLTGIPLENGGGTGGGTGDGNGETNAQIDLGAGSGDAFRSGALELSSSVSANGQVPVSVTVVDQAAGNAPYTAAPASVTFTSECAQLGLATLTESVSTQTGRAQATYSPNGCVGSDTITATLNSGQAIATGNIIVTSADAGAIAFSTAIPSTLALKNFGSTGLPTVSEVQFLVTDKAGKPVAGKKVNFEFDNASGGITLTNEQGETDANGIARVFVNSGSVKTTTRVIATLVENPDVKTLSTTISIGTGAPTQRSMSLSVDTFNPRALNYDGTSASFTIRVSDYYNNPIADGTTIAFYTNGGQIDRECVYSEDLGGCSVTWRSQNPRPDSGRVVVMAALKGEEETGPDHNGNGLFDGPPAESFEALPEAFVDDNLNGSWDSGEHYLDWDRNGQYTSEPATTFRGIRCTPAAVTASHCKTEMADIFESAWIVMAGDIDAPESLPEEDHGLRLETTGGTIIPNGSELEETGVTYRVVVADPNGNSAPNGTQISISITSGDDDIVGGNINYTVPPTTVSRYVRNIAFISATGPSALLVKVTNLDGSTVEKTYSIK